MDRNTIIGFILIAAVLIGFGYWNQPSAEQIAEQARQDSIATAQKKAKEEKAKLEEEKSITAFKDTTSSDSAVVDSISALPESFTTLQNNNIAVDITNKGGFVKKAVIKGYESLEGKSNVTVFEGDEQTLDFRMAGKDMNIITKQMTFIPVNATDSSVVMQAKVGDTGVLSIAYNLPYDSHLLQITLKAEGIDGLFSPNCNSMTVDWRDHCRQQEKSFSFENRYTSLTYKEAGAGTDYLNEGKDVEEAVEEPLDWVAYKTQFFSVVLIAEKQFAKNSTQTSTPEEKGGGYLKQFHSQMQTNFDPQGNEPTRFEMYVGPNNFRLLQKVSDQTTFDKKLELQDLIYLGWPIIKWINRWFTLYVFDFLTSMNISMGIILILITLLLKVITYPMVKKSYMSSAKMRVLKPKLEEATKEYNKPEDAMQKQQAMMQLYSQYGVSPLGGCLPMIIQMPIWIAMFNFVPNAIELRRQSFLWIKDLSTYDPIFEWTNNLPLIGDHLSLTCILFCAANVVYSVLSMRQQKDQMVGQQADQMKMLRWSMYLMPVMFFFIFNDYSAGLNFYYFISLFFSAAIMWTLRKTTNDEKLLATLEARYKENKAKPAAKQGGFAARLQELQKRQEDMRKQRGY